MSKTAQETFSDLPSSLLMDILIRTRSVKTIVGSRCVCKAWRDLLSDPYFAKLHHSTSPTCMLFDVRDFNHHKLRYTGLIEVQEPGENSFHPPPRYFPDIPSGVFKLFMLDRDYHVFGSCNGFLIWSSSFSTHPLYISNPMTREYMALRPLPTTSPSELCGLGFSPKTNQYKVIQLSRHDTKTGYHTWSYTWCPLVHTIGTQTWRSIGNFPYTRPSSCSIYLDGTHNWIAYCSSADSDLICSFDLETEQFRSLALLPTGRRQCDRIELGLFGDCLCVVCYAKSIPPRLDAEIWVLEKNNTWIKKVVINTSIGGFHLYEKLFFINVLENGEILFNSRQYQYDLQSLIFYNPMNGNSRSIRMRADNMIAHVPSFISLKDVVPVVTGEDWRVMDARNKVSIAAKAREVAFNVWKKVRNK